MFNKRTSYDRFDSNDALSALDRELSTDANPTSTPSTTNPRSTGATGGGW